MMMPSDHNITEGVHHDDLNSLIDPIASIDQYKSKIGNDENIIVIAILIKDKEPAEDLSDFIETRRGVLDVDTSIGPDTDGMYTVYIEINRDSKAFHMINDILTDIQQVDTEIDFWKFKSYERKGKVSSWTQENFKKHIISSSYEYVITHDPKARKIKERIDFLNKY
jgi:hypothetical protein